MASILSFASPRFDQRHDGVADQRKGHDDHGGLDGVRTCHASPVYCKSAVLLSHTPRPKETRAVCRSGTAHALPARWASRWRGFLCLPGAEWKLPERPSNPPDGATPPPGRRSSGDAVGPGEGPIERFDALNIPQNYDDVGLKGGP